MKKIKIFAILAVINILINMIYSTFKFNVNAENEIPDVDTNTSNSVEAEQNKTNSASEEETKTNSTPNNVTSNETKKNPVKATKSEIANLKSLGITPNDFKGFKPTTFSYNINVPNDVETVNVYATPQDRRARVTGLGNQKLNLGKNTIKITVTAESGAKKEYTLNITRQEEKEEEKVNKNTSSEVPNSKDLIELGLKGYEITPKFSPDVYSYKAFINADISEVEVVAKEASDKVEVEVVGNKDLINGENLITIFVYNKDTKQNSTYQIDLSKTNINFEENNATLTNATKKANFIINIILGVIIFILIMFVIFIIFKVKAKREEYEDDDDEENIYNNKLDLDDEDEFFDRINKNTSLKNDKKDTQKQADEIEIINYDDYLKKKKNKGKHF